MPCSPFSFDEAGEREKKHRMDPSAMYTTSADDLARIASDLDTLAKTYTDSAQQLDQEVTSLDGTASQLVTGGPERWVGQASEAFQGAWHERKARLQQASLLLTESAQHLKQLTRTIEEHLPTIRADQSLMGNSAYSSLAGADQQSILNEDSQAQNAIITALNLLNAQLESLAEEVKDCPEEQQGNANEPSDNVNESKSGEKGNRKDIANQQEKKEIDYAWSEIQRILKKKLSKDDRRRLHEEITGQGFDVQEIIEIGVSMFKDYSE